MNPNLENIRLSGGSKIPADVLQALASLNEAQRFDIAWSELGAVVHGVEVTEAVQCAAYWWDCNE